jgi:protoheme IX farnesyltransferase
MMSSVATLQAPPYRYLLAASVFVLLAQIAAGGHVLLALAVDTLVIACGAIALLRPHTAAEVRRPLLLALALVGLQALLLLGATWLRLPLLAVLATPGLSAFILALLLLAAVVLTVPHERHTTRPGARATRQARTHMRLTIGAALATWLLLLAISLALPPAGVGGALLLMSVLTLLALVFTWRTRRHDRALLRVAALAGVALLVLLAFGAAPLLALGTVPPWAMLLAGGVLWSALVLLAMLLLRRPVPALARPPEAAEPAREASETQPKQPSLIADYISLTKPKVISLLLLTTLAAMFITGEGLPSFALVCWTMLGGYLAAGGAGAINCAFDKDIDVNMGRTSRRPVPSNRISPRNAFVFGLVLSVLSFGVLFVFTTPLAAVLAVVGIVYYAVFYTRWLKPNTWQNIVIGGAAGALPPLVGWSAVTGSLSLPAVILFLIIFYWTPPHFWALALVKEKDYARAGVPMLPVVAGEAETRWQIWLYSLLMVVLTLLLTPLQAMGLLYLLLALVLGVIFIRYAWNVWRAGGPGHTWALYKYSLLYLALLFSAMVLDRMLLA